MSFNLYAILRQLDTLHMFPRDTHSSPAYDTYATVFTPLHTYSHNYRHHSENFTPVAIHFLNFFHLPHWSQYSTPI